MTTNTSFFSTIITVPRGKAKTVEGLPTKGIPPEDFATIRGWAIAVCDGVTLIHQHPYPRPSPAARASRLVAKILVALLKKSNGSMHSLIQAFIKANQAVRIYNRSIGNIPRTVDFLNRQYAATVAAFGVVAGRTLFWGQINDCGVMVLDKNGRIVMNRILDQRPYRAFIADRHRRGLSVAGTPEEHRFVRKHVVNNERLFYRRQPINWGVMTGEPKAVHFLRTGKIHLKSGNVGLFYSDGMIPFLQLATFRKKIASEKNAVKIKKLILRLSTRGPEYGKEKTVAIVRFRV